MKPMPIVERPLVSQHQALNMETPIQALKLIIDHITVSHLVLQAPVL
jgi:hypothetical protein